MNNKGFAISTLIYGLSIMGMMLIAILMGIMSVNRANNRALSNEIEEELNKFSQTDTVYTATTTGGQEYTVPSGESGWYRIELWGASGANSNSGLGAYTSGVIELEEEDKLYFFIGKQGTGSNGGGSTDVRLQNSSTVEGYRSRLMVAAGGGVNPGAHGGTLVGYTSTMVSSDGKLNITTGSRDYSLKTKNLLGYPDNYALSSLNTSNINSIGAVTPISSSGQGGSGFFSSSSASVGGTSYIAGYAGAKGVNDITGVLTNNPGYTTNVEVLNSENEFVLQPKTFYFVDGLMVPGVNKGNGRAKIERIVRKTTANQTLTRRNANMNGVTGIKDCVGEGEQTATKISAVEKGEEIHQGALIPSGNCVTVNFDGAHNIDEVAVWHAPGKDYTNHTISALTASGEKVLKSTNSEVKISETETPVGYRISAYQPDFTKTLPKSGNYYIMPVLTENKVVSAQVNSDDQNNPLLVEYIGGYKRQKWSIELITNPKVSPTGNEYKIVELARFRAMDVKNQQNQERGKIAARTEFNNTSRNDIQIWKITPIGNGTYIISTPLEVFNRDIRTGNIFAQLDQTIDGKNEVLIGRINNTTERFKLISVDYSSS